MGWPKGVPREGQKVGRKPGIPNKRTTALEACERMGFDPFEAMVKLAQEGDTKMIVELCQYIQPKLRALEHAIDPEKNSIEIIVRDYGTKA